MWFERSALLLGLIFAFECRSSDAFGSISSISLEESVELKLRTAARLRDNVLKIFNQLQSTDYELNHSIQQIKKHLKNGGSLIDSLHLLPTLGYAPVERQIKGILTALEKQSPRYLLPAISVVQNTISCSSNPLDIGDLLQPDGGPLRVDIFGGISAQDLSKLALPTPFAKDIEQHVPRGPWPSFVKKVVASISMGSLKRSTLLVGLILENLSSFNDNPELMESVMQFTQNSGSDDDKIEDLKLDSGPYEFLNNIHHSLNDNSPVEAIVETILSYLNEVSKRKEGPSELAASIVADKMNYSLLLLNNKQLMRTQSLLSLIQSDNSTVKNVLDVFPLYEYSTPNDLLTAVLSKLRRYQAQEGTVSEVVENVYEDLIGKTHYAWQQIPRSAGAMKSLFYSMKTDRNSPRIRRLATDVAATVEVNVRPEAWPKVLSSVSNVNCRGPSCIVLRTLEGFQEARVTEDQALTKSMSDLVRSYKRLYRDDILDSCPNLRDANALKDVKSTKTFERILNVDDLMQAIPGLDVKSEEYKNLRQFLSSKDLEKQIGGDIDVDEHPTRGRLLAWLLGKVEQSSNVDEGIRSTAGKFVDSIAYDGYGAAAVFFHRA